MPLCESLLCSHCLQLVPIPQGQSGAGQHQLVLTNASTAAPLSGFSQAKAGGSSLKDRQCQGGSSSAFGAKSPPATMRDKGDNQTLGLGFPILIRAPDGILHLRPGAWTDRELGLTDITSVASFPFLLSRMKNFFGGK